MPPLPISLQRLYYLIQGIKNHNFYSRHNLLERVHFFLSFYEFIERIVELRIWEENQSFHRKWLFFSSQLYAREHFVNWLKKENEHNWKQTMFLLFTNERRWKREKTSFKHVFILDV